MPTQHGLVERITKAILFLRGEKVLLDEDLAPFGVGNSRMISLRSTEPLVKEFF